MPDQPNADDRADYFELGGQALPRDPEVAEARRILASARRISVTDANKLGIERLLTLMGERPVTITKYGPPLGHMYSDDHWTKVFAVTTDLTSNSLHALAEVLTRLHVDELMAVVRPLMEILDFSERAEG